MSSRKKDKEARPGLRLVEIIHRLQDYQSGKEEEFRVTVSQPPASGTSSYAEIGVSCGGSKKTFVACFSGRETNRRVVVYAPGRSRLQIIFDSKESAAQDEQDGL